MLHQQPYFSLALMNGFRKNILARNPDISMIVFFQVFVGLLCGIWPTTFIFGQMGFRYWVTNGELMLFRELF